MIRLAGLACLVLCGGGAGWYAAMGLQRTRTAAECLSRMLREMAVQMEFRALSMQELLERLAQESSYGMFRFPAAAAQRMAQGDSVCQAWQTGLTQDKAVPESMRRILLPLGEELGASDLAGQAETLEQYRMQLEPYTAAVAERCQRLQRLYVSMGVLGGLLLAILLC